MFEWNLSLVLFSVPFSPKWTRRANLRAMIIPFRHTYTFYIQSSPTVQTHTIHTCTHPSPTKITSQQLPLNSDWLALLCCQRADEPLSLSLSLSLSRLVSSLCTIMRLLDTDSPRWLRVGSHQFCLCAYLWML